MVKKGRKKHTTSQGNSLKHIPDISAALHENAGTVGVTAATVVGGMVGAAAGYALSDTKRREMLMQKMDDLKNYVASALDEIRKLSEDTKEESEKIMTPVHTGKNSNKKSSARIKHKKNGHRQKTTANQHFAQ